jgi:hypothetical protein
LKLLLAWGFQFKRWIRKSRLNWMSPILDFLQIRSKKEEWRDVFIEAQSFDEYKKMVNKVIDYYNNEGKLQKKQ